jgi:chromate reductase
VITILGIPGSLRRRSYNRLLLENARDLVPDGVRVDIVSVGKLPLYDEDLDTETPPEPVARLRAQIRDADGLLIATPEYNYSVPGALKNAIDWASRPYGAHVLIGKPIAIMGASSGAFGTVRAQMHWRDIFLFTQSKVVTEPEVYVGNAPDRFDGAGRLVDERSRQMIRRLIENLVEAIPAGGTAGGASEPGSAHLRPAAMKEPAHSRG